ncbi:hypothetical protein [Alloactinosynnema sp. L-07]|nr:hypothetical protein [Alloactinosynnema sp. L-07]
MRDQPRLGAGHGSDRSAATSHRQTHAANPSRRRGPVTDARDDRLDPQRTQGPERNGLFGWFALIRGKWA